MPDLILTNDERAMLDGAHGDGIGMAMRLVVALATATGADRLVPITSAHIDGCLFTGQASLDFAEAIAGAGARVAVPATLNVSSLDLLHPGLFRGDPSVAIKARRLMDIYVDMGCKPTWTCAPYQLPGRPGRGEHVAWAESNAIVFVNSVLGARSNRYGDFIDICAAVAGRVPLAGLHRLDQRRGEMIFDVGALPSGLLARDVVFPVLGFLVGSVAGARVPVIVGLPAASEDQLKAFGAAAATSGSVGLFHAVGITPEAPDLDTALHGEPAVGEMTIDLADLRAARDRLTSRTDAPLAAVSVGTPHYSLDQIGTLVALLGGRRVHPKIRFYMSTARATLDAAADRGWLHLLEDSGVQPVVDTCTYITPIIDETRGLVLTDSAKWAYYAPGNIGVDVAFGSTEDCVESAVTGSLTYDEGVWNG